MGSLNLEIVWKHESLENSGVGSLNVESVLKEEKEKLRLPFEASCEAVIQGPKWPLKTLIPWLAG